MDNQNVGDNRNSKMNNQGTRSESKKVYSQMGGGLPPAGPNISDPLVYQA